MAVSWVLDALVVADEIVFAFLSCALSPEDIRGDPMGDVCHEHLLYLYPPRALVVG